MKDRNLVEILMNFGLSIFDSNFSLEEKIRYLNFRKIENLKFEHLFDQLVTVEFRV